VNENALGEFAHGALNVTKLPSVRRVLGASLDRGQDGKAYQVRFQYLTGGAGICELTLPIVDAMFVFAILESIQLGG
jgi:hypothetical protein